MANYAIMRIEKRKLAAVGRIASHHERSKREYKSNPDIDPARSGLNYHIVEPSGPYRQAVLTRIEEAGARRRKDSVVLQDCFIGATPTWLREKSDEEQRAYFNHAYQFFEQSFGKENIISAVVHMDEATPHMHLCFVPITSKGRLSSKDIIGGPQGLVKWQDRFMSICTNAILTSPVGRQNARPTVSTSQRICSSCRRNCILIMTRYARRSTPSGYSIAPNRRRRRLLFSAGMPRRWSS